MFYLNYNLRYSAVLKYYQLKYATNFTLKHLNVKFNIDIYFKHIILFIIGKIKMVIDRVKKL